MSTKLDGAITVATEQARDAFLSSVEANKQIRMDHSEIETDGLPMWT